MKIIKQFADEISAQRVQETNANNPTKPGERGGDSTARDGRRGRAARSAERNPENFVAEEKRSQADFPKLE
ncbi:MAG: hypothetical protein MUO63_06175 [Desulfobulbaceae bacterium]|nr:hypothetical protein [Desulfobulbaceae bacterium]